MDSQRLTAAESQLRNGDISVKGFVQAVALSDLYSSLFFENSSVNRFIELNFKHLLGRAPQDQAEIIEHVQILNDQGYEAEINSYLNSPEYQDNFDEDIVPYYRTSSDGAVRAKTIDFNRTFSLMRGYATSDLGTSARLISDVATNSPTKIKQPARASGAIGNTGKRFRISTVSSNTLARFNRRSQREYTVSFTEMSDRVQSLVKNGIKILSITEVT
jgi:hypothetical protein